MKMKELIAIIAPLFLAKYSNPIATRSAVAHSSGEHVTKDEMRAELERQAQRYKDVYGGEVVTYAAQPDPERKPWRKRPSLLDQAFQQELQKIEDQSKKALEG